MKHDNNRNRLWRACTTVAIIQVKCRSWPQILRILVENRCVGQKLSMTPGSRLFRGGDCKPSRGLDPRVRSCSCCLPRGSHSESLPAAPSSTLSLSPVDLPSLFLFLFLTLFGLHEKYFFPNNTEHYTRCRIVNHQRAFSTYSHANWGTLTCTYIDTFVAFYTSIFPMYDIVSVAVRLFEARCTRVGEKRRWYGRKWNPWRRTLTVSSWSPSNRSQLLNDITEKEPRDI